ncbi:hypothetical protein SPD48_17575 [Pseudogracilibacillus sp. SE30717A]
MVSNDKDNKRNDSEEESQLQSDQMEKSMGNKSKKDTDSNGNVKEK